MTNFEYDFNATCEVTDLIKCKAGTTLMDPCDCSRYYKCINTFSISNLTCNTGTLWDYTLGACNFEHRVAAFQNCSSTNAWTRCNTTASRLQELKSLCTGSPSNNPDFTAPPPKVEPDSDSSINAGMVAGLIIAGAVITLAIIALYVLYTRRKKAKAQDKLKRRTTIENREYFENGQIDDPYAFIDERMVSPVYNNTNQTGPTNGTISTTTTTLTGDETITEYDNSAFRDDDYATISKREPVTPYDTLTSSARSNEQPKNNSNNDAIGASSGDAAVAGSSGGNAGDDDSGVAVGGVSNGAEVDTGGKQEITRITRVNDDMDAPDYYKLGPE